MSFWQNFTLGFGSTQAQQNSTNNENTNAFDKRSKRPTETVETDKAHKRQALDDISNKKNAQPSSVANQPQKSLKSSSQQLPQLHKAPNKMLFKHLPNKMAME